ncbi:unnamed protein product [Closterium sp. NIES-53]
MVIRFKQIGVAVAAIAAAAAAAVAAAATAAASAATPAASAAADAVAAAAAIPTSEWPSSPWSSLLSSCPPTVAYRVRPCPAPTMSVLPPPPESSLTVSNTPIFDYYRVALLSLVSSPIPSLTLVPLRRLSGLLLPLSFELEFLASPSECAMLLSPEGDPDALDIPTPRTYRTYVHAVPPPRTNVVDGMWIFKVKRPPGSPPVFKARYVARGFSQREGVDFFHTFTLTLKMTTLRGCLHEEIWLRRPPGFTGTFLPGTQWSLRQPVYGLRQAPREWHDTLRITLAYLGFRPSSADPSLFVRRGSTPFFFLVYVKYLVFATAYRVALTEVKSKLQKRHTCTDLCELRRYLGLQITRDKAACTITLS